MTEPMTITLWDFTWYTRSAPGEPFADLDEALRQAVDRGYNTIRICAMPWLLFRSGLDTSALVFEGLGGEYGQRMRWYDVRTPATVDGRAWLLSLFQASARHDVRVIVSSWEYQQSPSFADHDAWYRGLYGIDPDERAVALADAHADLIDFLKAHGLDDRVAFVELHNEIQYTGIARGLNAGFAGLTETFERGLARFTQRQPDIPVTVNVAHVPVGELRFLPKGMDVAIFHPYVYGVLDELTDEFALRDLTRPYPQERARRELLRDDAPPLEDWQPAGSAAWKLEATLVMQRLIYTHDWCDPDKWDRWLYERYGEHRRAMREVLDLWIDAAANFAAERGIPLVFGEGWVGYTPLHATFEEGPVGAAICEHAIRRSADVGAWGTIVCSNAAPHHPMWQNVALQRRLNTEFLKATTVTGALDATPSEAG